MVISLRGAHINYSPVVNNKIANIYKTCFPAYDLFHAVSNAMALQAIKFGANAASIKVIYSGIDESKVQKKNYKTGEVLKILSIGRMHWVKGYDYAINAMHILKDKGIKVQYTIIGSGNQDEYLFLKHDRGLDKNIEILNAVSFDKLMELMVQFDALLLPSNAEGIANVAIEAMSIGLPVLSSNLEGMNELLVHADIGLMFNPRNSFDMANAILKFYYMKPSEKEAMATKARDSLQGKFDFETFKQNYNSFYQLLS